MFKLTDIAIILFITTAINCVATYISWRRRKSRNGIYFTLGMMATTLWTLGAALGYAAVPLELKILFAKMDAVGYNLALPFFIFFALHYGGFGEWANKKWVRISLAMIPVLTLSIILTNELHGWMWRGFLPVANNIVVFEHGPFFPWLTMIAYLLFIVLVVVIVLFVRRGSEFSQRQGRVFLYAVALIVGSNIIYQYWPGSPPGVDWSSISFSITSLLFLRALYGQRLLDIVPIARNHLVDGLPDGMIVLDTQNRVIDINHAARSLFQSIVLGKNPTEQTLPFVCSFLATPAEKEVLTEIEMGEKEKKYFDVTISPLYSEKKDILGRLIVFRNISERKIADAALRASEERFRQLVVSAPDVVFGISLDGTIIFANDETSRMLGYSLNELVGMSTEQIVPFALRAAYSEWFKEYTANPYSDFINRVDLAVLDRNNLEIPVDIKLSSLKTDTDILTIVFMRDITQRKLAESKLREQAELIELTNAAFIVRDLHGRVQYMNPSAVNLYGWSGEEMMGRDLYEVLQTQFSTSPDDIKQSLFETGHWRGHLTQTCKDGKKLIVSSRQVLRRDAQGNPASILSLSLDITERVEKDAALKQAQAAIVENERVMALFQERVRLAHELHDSIGQTVGYINMQLEAVREWTTQGNQENALPALTRLSEVTQKAHGDIRGIIHTLQSEEPVLRQEFFAALGNYCKHYEESFLFKIQLNLPPTLPNVLAAPETETHLTYIIREALNNARRHSGQNQASITIEIEAETVQTIIQDHGIGFDTTYVGRDRRKNSHLGLGIMLERAKEIGGAVTIESGPATGTRITVRLPRGITGRELPKARILIVDDHPLFIEGLKNMLTARGIHVIGIATDGVEAQEMARALKPDLILMDIHMPRMNGLEATRLIKTELPEIKIVMLTTSIENEDVFEALHFGASGYLLKGMGADEFMATLGDVLRGEAEFSPEMAHKILNVFGQLKETASRKVDDEHGPDGLSSRQIEILRLVAQGLGYRSIGERLFLAESTVKYHMGEILTHLHLKKRREAEEYARQRGLI